MSERQFRSSHPEWCEDRRFATNQARMANRDALEDVMNAVPTTKDHQRLGRGARSRRCAVRPGL